MFRLNVKNGKLPRQERRGKNPTWARLNLHNQNVKRLTLLMMRYDYELPPLVIVDHTSRNDPVILHFWQVFIKGLVKTINSLQ